MATKVRDADLRGDRDELIHFVRENLTKDSNASRFEWLYLRNPNGPARAWMAIDEGRGCTVGVAAAFPRRVWLNGQARQAYVLGDFCIAPECRSLGPALSLQRACLSSLRADQNAIYFDFPSDRMVAIYRRLGIETAGDIVRYVKLLRVDSKVRSLVSRPVLASGISAVGNLALRLQQRRRPVPNDLVIGIHEGAFGDEFTHLNARAAGLYPAHGLRSAEYLNWRYRQNPLRNYQVIVARRGGELVGYTTLAPDGNEWRLSDLFAINDGRAVAGMLAHVQSLAQTQKIERLTAPMVGHPYVAHLTEAGFYPREGHPLIMYAENSGPALPQNANSWFLMDGDRES